jgi:hypothetical protein
MAYVTVDQLKQYLKQWEGFPEEDELFTDVIARAESIINEYLGFTFAGYDASATERIISAYGTPTLVLPPHQIGSITTITLEDSDTALTGWTEDTVSGNLTFEGWYPFTGWGAVAYSPFNSFGYWGPARYAVTAKWGYGTVPASIQEVALELAVNIFRGRDRGLWTDIVGVEGSGGLRFTGGITNQQRAILDAVRERYTAGEVAI